MGLQSLDQLFEFRRADLPRILLRKRADILRSINAGELLPSANADAVIHAFDELDHFTHVVLRCNATVAGPFAIDSICSSDRREEAEKECKVDGYEEAEGIHSGYCLLRILA